MARPAPTTRGSRYAAPMSPPDNPTLVNRKAKRPFGPTMRKSLARATTAPAPAAIPWMTGMMGTGHSRMARMTSPVILVNRMRSAAPIWISSPMISSTSPPPQNPRPSPRMTSTRTSV